MQWNLTNCAINVIKKLITRQPYKTYTATTISSLTTEMLWCKYCKSVTRLLQAKFKQICQLSGLVYIPTCQSLLLTSVQCIIDFSLFGLGGLTSGQSPPQGEMSCYLVGPVPTQVYHAAKFNCPASTHATDMHYK